MEDFWKGKSATGRWAEVTKVDADNLRIEARSLEDEQEWKGLALDLGQEVVEVPAEGSLVFLLQAGREGSYWLPVFFGQSTETRLRGQAFGGLVKVGALVERLNALENKVNELLAEYRNHSHPFSSQVSDASLSNEQALANEQIKHGT